MSWIRSSTAPLQNKPSLNRPSQQPPPQASTHQGPFDALRQATGQGYGPRYERHPDNQGYYRKKKKNWLSDLFD